MEKNHPVSELMAETIEKIKEAVDANTVVGSLLWRGRLPSFPSQRSPWDLALAARRWGENPEGHGENPFGGGGGAGLKVTPVCFLVINAGMVKVLPVDTSHETSLDRVVDLIPDVVNRIAGLVEEKKAKKPASEEPDGPAGNP